MAGFHHQPDSHPRNEPECDSAGDDTNEGEAGCIGLGLLQRQSTKKRIARECDHRRKGQDENPRGFQEFELRTRG